MNPSRVPVAFGLQVCAALRGQAARLGVDLGTAPAWPPGHWAEERDPYSGERCQIGTWRDGDRYGTVRFLADGRVFAEYQVLLPHPSRPGQAIEAVSVWGTAGALKGDPVLMPWVDP